MRSHSTTAQLDLDVYREQAEWAWAAGLFEGEGTIRAVLRPTGHIDISLRVSMTDRDVVERLRSIVGAGTIHVRQPRIERHKVQFEWAVNGRKALPLIERMLPWLGERRSAKAREALALGATYQLSETHCPHGHAFSTENIYLVRWPDGRIRQRRCRICDRLRGRAYFQKHKEQAYAWRRAYREEHKEQINAGQRAYREEHREAMNARRRAHWQNNKDQMQAQQRAYYEEHKEHKAAQARAYYHKRKEARAVNAG